MLKLFTAKGTIGLACEIVLEESGAEYEVERLNFAENQQRGPDFLAVNPKSRVPALACDEGIITETPAILAYVAERFAAAGLAPSDDIFAAAQVTSFNAYLASWVHPAAAHRYRGYRWADDPAAIVELARKAPEVFGEAMALIDSALLNGPWVHGERYTTSDPYLYVVSTWIARDGLSMADYPKIADHFARMNQRPAVREVLERVG